jgi:sn-glycerol 3-phosphate transport system substrate-binding protein
MIRTSTFSLAAALVSVLAAVPVAAAPLDIHFWHPSLGAVDEALQKQIGAFNASQSDYRVVSSGRGTYDETFNAMIAAYRAGKQPHLVTAIGQETLTLQLSGAVYPVQDLFKDAGLKLDVGRYLTPVANYYTSRDGKLMSLPFSTSTPILWFNKDAFAKAGLTRAPQTWEEVGEYAAKLKASGMACGYASAWQQWVHIDNFAFMHNVPVATRRNGVDGLDAEFVFDKGEVVRHLERVQAWARNGHYEYAGPAGQQCVQLLCLGALRHDHAVIGHLHHRAPGRQVRPMGAAVMPMNLGATPGPQPDWRRIYLGHQGPQADGLQGCCCIPGLPVQRRRTGAVAQGHRLCALHA